MSSQLITKSLEVKFEEKAFVAYLNKLEFLYRKYLRDTLKLSEKFTGDVNESIYEEIQGPLCKKCAAETTSVPPIKTLNSYCKLAFYLAINYENLDIKSYVDQISALCENKVQMCEEVYRKLNLTENEDQYYRNLNLRVYNIFRDVMNKNSSEVNFDESVVTVDVFRKCLNVAFFDSLCHIGVEKSSTFSYDSDIQLRLFTSRCSSMSILNAFVKLYVLCKPPPPKSKGKATGTTKGKGKGKPKKEEKQEAVDGGNDFTIADDTQLDDQFILGDESAV